MCEYLDFAYLGRRGGGYARIICSLEPCSWFFLFLVESVSMHGDEKCKMARPASVLRNSSRYQANYMYPS